MYAILLQISMTLHTENFNSFDKNFRISQTNKFSQVIQFRV